MKVLVAPPRILSLCLAVLFLSLNGVSAWAGHDQGNGGDSYAIEFVKVGQRVSAYLKTLAPNELQGIDVDRLSEIVATARVESTDLRLQLNGVPKDAINYPTRNRIVFNRSRWKKIRQVDRSALVLHEYLGLLGIDDQNYLRSQNLLIRYRDVDSGYLLCDFPNAEGTVVLSANDDDSRKSTLIVSVQMTEPGPLGASDFRFVTFQTFSASISSGIFSYMVQSGNVTLSASAVSRKKPSPWVQAHLNPHAEERFKAAFVSLQRTSAENNTLQGSIDLDGVKSPLTCIAQAIVRSRVSSKQ